MWRCELFSPRLFLPHECLSTHLGTTGGADWRFVGIERCSSTWGVLFPEGGEFCVVQPAISVPWSPVNKFTVLTIENPNTIDSELVNAPPPTPWFLFHSVNLSGRGGCPSSSRSAPWTHKELPYSCQWKLELWILANFTPSKLSWTAEQPGASSTGILSIWKG